MKQLYFCSVYQKYDDRVLKNKDMDTKLKSMIMENCFYKYYFYLFFKKK
jgi:hypothetical protein